MNKVMLIGHVGTEPEVRYVDHDVAVARLRIATTERGYTLANGTQVPDRTDWHTVLLWRRLAEIVEKYVHKGDKLYVEGRLRYTTYDDKQGRRQYQTEIWADNMEMLTPKQASQQSNANNKASANRPTGASEPNAQVQSDSNDLPF